MANAAISMAYHRLPQTLCRPQEGRRLVQQWNSAATRPQHIIWARYSTSSTIPTQTQKDQQIRTTERFKELNKLLEDVARTAISTGPRGAIRLAQGIEAVVSVGSEYLLQLYRNPPTAAATSPNTMPSFILNPPGAADLRRLFERLGATYIKLGQFIASAPTLFPAEYVKEFQSCLDKTPAVSFNEIKAIIRQELGRPLEEVYDFIDPQPLASASVAQVHAARLRGSQKEVVIKVLKPGVEDILTADLSFLYVTARILEFLNPQLSRTSLVGIVGDIRASMLEEVDFRKEAMNIDSFRNYVEVMGLAKQATAPFVYRHCSTQRVLTMERLYGVPFTDLNSIRSIVPSPEATLITALNVWFGSLIACETFHADVHAGNLLVLNDGRVGFIDFGIVGRISPPTWAAMETFLASVGNGQYTAMATALVQMGATDSTVDITSFSRDLEKIFSAVQDLDTDVLITTTAGGPGSATVAATMAIDEQQINALLLDVIRVSEAYGLKFPREFGLLLKQLLYFDRYTRLLAPNLNVLEDDRISLRNRGSPPDPFGPRQPRF
ncbi:unnamed protein product [Sphagnum jensenii]|uniref:Protein kinase domain-containing protein n=1 Tax=Sphagnum jensenii TaxID=128206 RepID=A0ABP1BHS2_9BRYO